MKSVLCRCLVVLSILLLVAFLQPTASFAGQDERVIIEFAPGSGAALRARIGRAGGEIHYRFDRLNAVAATLPSSAVDALRRNPNVVSIEADALRYPMAVNAEEIVPWGIDAVWDAEGDAGEDLGALTGAGVTVCIIDSGLYTGHEDLEEVTVMGGYPEGWDTDMFGHGTHVAGTIAAQLNELGVVGLAPEVSLYIVKVFGDDGLWAYSSTLVDATERCVDNAEADIISMSLGGTKSMRMEQRQFDSLYAAGVLSVAAAGNDGVPGEEDIDNYPASYSSVVSVAAIDENLDIADFSQNNDQVELAAPGVSVLSTVPYSAIANLTVDDVTYSGNLIDYAALGTASGPLVDGGLCDAGGTWSGAVVLCERGDISFYDKVMNVQNSGGAAAVIYNNEPGNFLGTLGEDDSSASEIPAISLSQEDGQYLVANKLGSTGDMLTNLLSPASSYEKWDGTSMATPHVSAVAALLWSTDPDLSNADVRDAMTATALDLGADGRDMEYGYGLVQAYDAWQYLGEGPGPGDELVLTVSTSRSRGTYYANLSWTGTDQTVHITKNGVFLATVSEGTAYTDSLDRRPSGSFTYQVCETDGELCSNEFTINF